MIKNFFKEPFFEKILRYLRARKVLSYIHKAEVICDIGCGFNAYFLNKAKKYITKGYGIDKKVSIKSTDKIILQRAEFFDNLPFQNNFFDAVTMIAVIEHLQDYNSIIKEIYRILKPEGLLIITTPTTQAKKI
ncbi:MAG: class I SAM-dependent methyltransferase, partial [Candidatus Humimicrobiaceae bacterium]